MARHYAALTCSNTADLFGQLNTFLVGTVGWTLLDDQSGAGTPYYIYRAPGEDGYGYRYYRITSGSTTALNFRAYRFWNESTQTGSYEIGNSTAFNGIIGSTSAFVAFAFADLDGLWVASKISNAYYIRGFGLTNPIYGDDKTVTTNSASAGSNVVIPVADDSFFVEGEYYEIANTNSATGAQERVQVTNVGSGEITVATLANAHPSGALIAKQVMPIFLHTGSASTDNTYGWRINAGGATATPQSISDSRPMSNGLSPDALEGKFQLWPGFVNYSTDNMVYGATRDIFAVPTTDLSSEDIITVNGFDYMVFSASRGPISTSGRLAILKGATP